MSSIKPVFFVGRTACPLIQPGFQKKVPLYGLQETELQETVLEFLEK